MAYNELLNLVTKNYVEPFSYGEVYKKVKRTVDCEKKVTDSAENCKPCRSETTATTT
jgi:reverse gyrase